MFSVFSPSSSAAAVVLLVVFAIIIVYVVEFRGFDRESILKNI
jgi:hypothetical protein